MMEKLITEGEFLIAVEVIKNYKKQIDSTVRVEINPKNEITLEDFARDINRHNVSVRLRKIFENKDNLLVWKNTYGVYFISDFRSWNFLKPKSIGYASWTEFRELMYELDEKNGI